MNLLGDCDVVVAELCRRAGWSLQHPMVGSEEVVVSPHEELDWAWRVRPRSVVLRDESAAAVAATSALLNRSGVNTDTDTGAGTPMSIVASDVPGTVAEPDDEEE